MLKKIRKATEKKIRLNNNKTRKGYDTFPKSIIYNSENTDEESTPFSIATGNSLLTTRNSQLHNSTTHILPTPN